jgi:hypothetical protein
MLLLETQTVQRAKKGSGSFKGQGKMCNGATADTGFNAQRKKTHTTISVIAEEGRIWPAMVVGNAISEEYSRQL